MNFVQALKEVFINQKEKMRNPILGTAIALWMIHKWELFYTTFTFDKGTNLTSRVTTIKNFFKDDSFLLEALIYLSIAIGILIATYIFKYLGYLIRELFDGNIKAGLDKILHKTRKFYTKEEFEEIQKDRDHYTDKYDEERTKRLQLENDFERREKELIDYKSENEEFKPQYEKLNVSNAQLIKEIDSLKVSLNEEKREGISINANNQITSLTTEIKDLKEKLNQLKNTANTKPKFSPKELSSKLQELISQLGPDKLKESFGSVSMRKPILRNNALASRLVNKGVIVEEALPDINTVIYKFTPLGEQLKPIVLNDENEEKAN